MNQIERLSKYDLAVTVEYDGKKGQIQIVTGKEKVLVLDYNKVLDKLNELIDVANRLEEKVNEMA